MNVIVYTGPGTAPANASNAIATLTPILAPFYSITTVSSPKVFTSDSWQASTVLIIFPGGRDVPYCNSLNGAPNSAILSWVRHRGGKYLGFCAGGYYGSKRCEFEIGDKLLEVAGPRELGFFPGTCRGAAFEGFVYDSENGAKAAALQINQKEFPWIKEDVKAYCNGGGIFVDADFLEDRGVTILARFVDPVKVEGGDAAAVYCKVGKGGAILTGVHPEIRAAQLNKADGGPEFVKVIDELLVHDAGRSAFLRAFLIKLGLKVYPEDEVQNGDKSHTLTPIHISSASESFNREIYNSLITISSVPRENGEIFTITETNDTFHVQYITSSLDSMRDLSQALNGHYRSSSVDPQPKCIFIHPSPMTYAYFSPKQYFQFLPRSSNIGQTLAYVEITTSTQTILDKNPGLLKALPPGFCIVATSQLNGRGRAGNTWISPRGSLSFSYIVHLPRQLFSRLVFVQYLVSLAIVEGIKSYAPGWEDVNVGIKWPNDVYGKARGSDRWEKICGIIVNSTYADDKFILVIGCGINTTNPHPTTSLLHIIPEHLEHPSHERLLANFLSTFSEMFDEFLISGFRTFEKKYYERWLHTNQIVSIENGMTRGIIRGINFQDGASGGLIIDEVDMQDRSLGKRPVEVVADGNSFDMMKGLLRKKA